MYGKVYYVLMIEQLQSATSDSPPPPYANCGPGESNAYGRYTDRSKAEIACQYLLQTTAARSGQIRPYVAVISQKDMIDQYTKDYDFNNGLEGYRNLRETAERQFSNCDDDRFYPEAMINGAGTSPDTQARSNQELPEALALTTPPLAITNLRI